MPVRVNADRPPRPPRQRRGVAPAPPGVRPPRPDLPAPQAKVLSMLVPASTVDPVHEWPILCREAVKRILGYSPTNSINRILNHPKSGLLTRKLIEPVEIDVEGVVEVNYRITQEGIRCLSAGEQGASR